MLKSKIRLICSGIIAISFLVLWSSIAVGQDCTGITLQPGDSIQAAIDKAPAGQAFCIKSGIHKVLKEIVPKSGNSFVGIDKPVMQGNGVGRAFAGYGGVMEDVVIRKLVFENFDTAIKTTTGWIVENSEFRKNRVGLFMTSPNVIIRGNYIHDNRQYGMTASGADNGLIENNEIARNHDGTYWDGDSGGTKFIRSNGLTLRGNYVHHNTGHGLWTDGNNINIIYEGNIVEHNMGAGIFHEISHDAIIRNNILRSNGDETVAGRSIWWGSNIHLNGGKNVEIYDNMIEAGGQSNAIGIVNTQRGSGWYGKWESRNVYVHDNVIEMKSGATTGFVGDSDANQNIRFENNHYSLMDLTGRYWSWKEELTRAQWQAKGQDRQGKFEIICVCQ